MRLFYKHIYKTLMGPLILGIVGSTFIFLVDTLSEIVQSVIIRGIPLLKVLEILSYDIIHLLVLSIPMGVMIGAILGYDSLSKSNELVAFKSLGISERSVILPPFIVGIFFSSLLFTVNQFLSPIAKVRRDSLLQEIAYNKPVFRFEDNTFMTGLKNYSIYVKEGKEKGSWKFLVFQNHSYKFSDVMLGEGLKGVKGALVLENAINYEIDDQGKRRASSTFEKQSIPLREVVSNFGTLDGWPEEYLLSFTDLYRRIQFLKREGYSTLRLRNMFHWKIALTFSPIILALLSALLASDSHRRFGKGDNIALGIALLFFYWLWMIIGRGIANDELLKPYIVMWTPNVLYALLAFHLYLRRARA